MPSDDPTWGPRCLVERTNDIGILVAELGLEADDQTRRELPVHSGTMPGSPVGDESNFKNRRVSKRRAGLGIELNAVRQPGRAVLADGTRNQMFKNKKAKLEFVLRAA